MKDSNREAFESWATDKFPIAGLGQFEKHNNGTYLQRSIRNMYEAWQAAKAQAVPETQQSKQAEIDDLNAQLKAVHDSRIEFVEYCRMIESGDFVIVAKKDTEVWWQDSEEPENFATKEDDLSFIAQHIEDDEVMEINEHHTVHLPSVTKFGAWVYQNGQRKFFVGTKDEVEAARGRK